MFKLPAYQELSKQQDKVTNLPSKGTHLIVGPPGTGKTVVAIYRAEMDRDDDNQSRFIVYNNTLNQYLDLATQQKSITSNTSTFHSWFGKWYRNNFYRKPPQLEPYIFDWDKIFKDIGRVGNKLNKERHIILDEGQDFPKELYMLLPHIAENITVFADENQRIHDQNSTIEEIRTGLGLKTVYPLTKNYRNSKSIAKFAREFYTGLSSGVPDLPDRIGSLPQMISDCGYFDQITRISNYARNNPTKQVGVFVWTRETQWGFFQGLLERISDVPIQIYQGNNRKYNNVDFNKNGIFILCYASTKGLEFDTVFLPELQDIRTDANPDAVKMRFYVLTSRARDELILMSRNGSVPWFMQGVNRDLFSSS